MTLVKAIVFALALANLGVLLWIRGVGAPVESPAAAPVDTLRLASEAGLGPRGTASVRGGARGGTPPAVAAGATAGATKSGSAAAGSAPAGSAVADSAASLAPADSSAAKSAGTPRRCISVGPFRDVAEAAHAASTLRTSGYDPRQRVADGEISAGVWVYVPVPATRGATEQALGRLKQGGIDDALQMPGPNDAAVISLGLYLEPKRAQARVAQAQALGFNPSVLDRKRTGNVYWIDIDLKPSDPILNPGDLQIEGAHNSRPEVKDCPPGPPA